MKLPIQKTIRVGRDTNKGFTLIEMIGVLAVIAILAAVLVPKVFNAINSSRVSNAAMACNTVKTAVADHYAKWNSIAVDGSTGTAVPITVFPAIKFDQILLKETFLDKPFAVKIGDGSANNQVQLFSVTALTAPDIASGTYNLDGTTTGGANGAGGSDGSETPKGSVVVEAILAGVSLEDAAALDVLIDGPTMSSKAATGTDMNGRVKWKANAAGTGYDVNVYLTHR